MEEEEEVLACDLFSFSFVCLCISFCTFWEQVMRFSRILFSVTVVEGIVNVDVY